MSQMDYIIETRRMESFNILLLGQQDALNESLWRLQEFQIGLN